MSGDARQDLFLSFCVQSQLNGIVMSISELKSQISGPFVVFFCKIVD